MFFVFRSGARVKRFVGEVCFSENAGLWQLNLMQNRSKHFFRICKQSGLRHRRTRDCEGCQPSAAIPFAKHVTENERKFEKFKECFVPRQRTE